MEPDRESIAAVRAAIARWMAAGASALEIPPSVVRFALDGRGCEATRVGIWDALMAVSDECEDCDGEGSHCDDSHPGNAAVKCEHCDGHGRVPKGTPTSSDHYRVGRRLQHHTGAIWEVDAVGLVGDGETWCGGSVLGEDDYIIRCVLTAGPANLDREGHIRRVHANYLHGAGWRPCAVDGQDA